MVDIENVKGFLAGLIQKASFIEIEENDKFTVLNKMVESSPLDDVLEDKKDFLKKLIEREKMVSTGIGNKVAVPHTHSDKVKDYFIILGYSKNGIDFDSIDAVPVNLFILIGTPGKDPERRIYLKILSEISKMVKNTSDVSLLDTKEKVLKIFLD